MLSKKTKYGLKALSYLSKQEENNPVLISDISKSENISRKFLEKYTTYFKKKWNTFIKER